MQTKKIKISNHHLEILYKLHERIDLLYILIDAFNTFEFMNSKKVTIFPIKQGRLTATEEHSLMLFKINIKLQLEELGLRKNLGLDEDYVIDLNIYFFKLIKPVELDW